MSDFKGARPAFMGARPAHCPAARSVRRRWPARLFAGALTAGMLWFLAGAILALFHHGPLTVAAKRGEVVVSVRGNGVVESADHLDLQNRVSGRRNILEIVPNGSFVRKGAVVLRLDSASLEETIAVERAALSKAEAAVIRAKKTWQATSIAVDEYDQGVYLRQRHELSRQILNAQQRLASVEHSLLQIQIMFRKGWVSPPHVEAMKSAVEKEQANLDAAKQKRDVLDHLTRAKIVAELSGKRDAAAARWQAAEAVLRTKKAKIARLLDDVKHCTIRAPRDGMVVYCGTMVAENQPRIEQGAIYPGAPVRQSQTLVSLVDPGRLQVKLFLPRGKLSGLRRGGRAHVTVLGQELLGVVASIADRPEVVAMPGQSLRQYPVAIALDNRGDRLKPGMSAEVDIIAEHKPNALVIPAICVADERVRPYVRVKKRGGVAMREVKLGLANDTLVEILQGVNEGELVLLNPKG